MAEAKAGPRPPRGNPPASAAEQIIDLTSDLSFGARNRLAWRDVGDAFGLLRLAAILGWLDIRLRYRGSLLGPLWLTLSTAVMVGALGFLYSTLFQMDVSDYLPFLALSLVLWNFLGTLVSDACICFTAAEGIVRSVRLPFTLHAIRCVIRNVLVLAHNVVVIVVVDVVFCLWPGADGLVAVPGVVLWLVDGMAVCLLLGAICARFRDVPPIIGSVMQIAFFISAIMWKPAQIGGEKLWLQLNPFYALIEIVRAPLLGELPSAMTYASAIGWSVLLCAGAWMLFMRTRGRIAFWV